MTAAELKSYKTRRIVFLTINALGMGFFIFLILAINYDYFVANNDIYTANDGYDSTYYCCVGLFAVAAALFLAPVISNSRKLLLLDKYYKYIELINRKPEESPVIEYLAKKLKAKPHKISKNLSEMLQAGFINRNALGKFYLTIYNKNQTDILYNDLQAEEVETRNKIGLFIINIVTGGMTILTAIMLFLMLEEMSENAYDPTTKNAIIGFGTMAIFAFGVSFLPRYFIGICHKYRFYSAILQAINAPNINDDIVKFLSEIVGEPYEKTEKNVKFMIKNHFFCMKVFGNEYRFTCEYYNFNCEYVNCEDCEHYGENWS